MIEYFDDLDVAGASTALARGEIEALEIEPPPARLSRYQELARRVVDMPRFMLDLGGSWAQIHGALHAKLAPVCRARSVLADLSGLLEDIGRVLTWASSLAHARRTLVSVRNWFAPGDLVWHVDRSRRSRALRILWPIGRIAGIHVTSRASIDPVLYRAWMVREHPLLCRLDRMVFETHLPLERLWSHRPRQLRAMVSDDYPFMLDPQARRALRPHAISVHRIETPWHPGTWHRSAFENCHAPGLQLIMTVTT